MEYTGKERRQLFELRPVGKDKKGILVDKRRMIIGSSDQCDIVLNFSDIGPIHAILEMTKDGKKLYDMNSTAGCFINDEKIIDGSYKEGDKLKFGSHEFEFKQFVKEEIIPPVLDMLDPTLPPRVTPPLKGGVPKPPPTLAKEIITPKGKPAMVPRKKAYIPKVAYPLAEDAKAEYSEYIFEDTEDLIPIFTYEEKISVEVTIMFGERIFSVDYLPVKNRNVRLVGRSPSAHEVELPLLPKKEKLDFINISEGKIQVQPILGYESLLLADENAPVSDGPINLGEDDIFRFYKNNIQIYIRQSSSPPKVKSAPIFPKDGTFSKSLAIVYFILAFFLVWMQFFVTVDKEKEEAKAPKRIAKILYKPKPRPKKVAKAAGKKKSLALPTAKKKKKTQVKKKKAVKKVARKVPRKKVAPPKAKVKVHKKVVARKSKPKAKRAGPPKAPRKAPKKVAARKAKRRPSKGRVETYKSFDFKSNLSSLMAKGGTIKTVSAKTRAKDADMGIEGSVGAGGATDVKKAKIDAGIGSLEGAAAGKLEAGSSASGLADKKSIFTAGVPGNSVVYGSYDGDIIKEILRRNSPQFRYCYQQQLDDTTKGFSGIVKINFIIGASGSVSRAGVESSDSSLPKSISRCVINVVKGLRFPPPDGGGKVEVVQPFSFQSPKS
ncbi:MAG: hypothetical protein DRQ88_07600 [Epsilonproteobacteria bacterium]|nr:MAG: hypothetical protein DRQ89_03345 [Campylobacterota bacterium]RLA66188.1 MAG: hypothetical protein DRQ88_07600 [Campylobacterota bacterium]